MLSVKISRTWRDTAILSKCHGPQSLTFGTVEKALSGNSFAVHFLVLIYPAIHAVSAPHRRQEPT